MSSLFHDLPKRTRVLQRGAQILRRPPLMASCAAALVATIGYAGAAQPESPPQPGGSAPIYSPYPPGILPADINAEIARVQAEIRTIFGRYLAQSQALPPLTFSNTQGVGNPPIIQGAGYEAMRILGGLLNYDENMSPMRNVACAFCHMP